MEEQKIKFGNINIKENIEFVDFSKIERTVIKLEQLVYANAGMNEFYRIKDKFWSEKISNKRMKFPALIFQQPIDEFEYIEDDEIEEW